MSGKTPPQPGHPVRGKGTSAGKGTVYAAKAMKSGGTKVGGKGTKSSRGANTGKAGRY